MPAAQLRGPVRGHGRRRAVLRHLRAGAGRLAGRAWSARRRPASRVRRAGAPRRRPPSAPRPRRTPRVPLPRRPRRVPGRPGVRSPGGCRARCPGPSTARARSRCAVSGSSAAGSGRNRLGAGLVSGTGGAAARPALRGAGEPGGARAQAVLLALATAALRWAVRAANGRAVRRASAPSAATRTPSCRSCVAATSCTASTRSWAVSRTAGSAGSIWPWTVRCPTAGWCSRACSTRATRTPWPPRSPSAASSRRSSTPTSSGSTTSSSTSTSAPARLDGYIVMEYVGGKSLKEIANDRRTPGGQARPAAGRAGVRVRHRGAGGARPSAQPEPAVLRLQGRQRHPAAGPAQAHRHGRGAAGWTTTSRAIYGTVGYQAPEVADDRPVGRLRPLHGGAHAGGADLRLPGLHERLRGLPAGPGEHRGLPAVRVLLPAAGARDRPGSGAALRLGAGDGGAADGRAAGGRRAPDGTARGPRCRRCSAPNCGSRTRELFASGCRGLRPRLGARPNPGEAAKGGMPAPNPPAPHLPAQRTSAQQQPVQQPPMQQLPAQQPPMQQPVQQPPLHPVDSPVRALRLAPLRVRSTALALPVPRVGPAATPTRASWPD